MIYLKTILSGTLCILFSLAAWGQEAAADRRPRLLLGAEAGTHKSLGYKLPSSAFGPSLEVPVAKQLEFQADAFYSPNRKYITGGGQSLNVGGSTIGFLTPRSLLRRTRLPKRHHQAVFARSHSANAVRRTP